MEWLDELRAAMEAEKLTGRLIGTLATVDAGGLPRARSVVCRRVDEKGAVWVASDARSGKNEQLRQNPHAELVVWLPTPRLQFRVQGEIRLLDAKAGGDERAKLWRELSDTARALFSGRRRVRRGRKATLSRQPCRRTARRPTRSKCSCSRRTR
jgi:pyridoxamine 5'-phosphate oxidase